MNFEPSSISCYRDNGICCSGQVWQYLWQSPFPLTCPLWLLTLKWLMQKCVAYIYFLQVMHSIQRMILSDSPVVLNAIMTPLLDSDTESPIPLSFLAQLDKSTCNVYMMLMWQFGKEIICLNIGKIWSVVIQVYMVHVQQLALLHSFHVQSLTMRKICSSELVSHNSWWD